MGRSQTIHSFLEEMLNGNPAGSRLRGSFVRAAGISGGAGRLSFVLSLESVSFCFK
ncbi:hypothetical protein MPC1_670004 [Methylocella tundrae]|nr:hypothetical protein MPC1_670004 [Methylocella tundrae]